MNEKAKKIEERLRFFLNPQVIQDSNIRVGSEILLTFTPSLLLLLFKRVCYKREETKEVLISLTPTQESIRNLGESEIDSVIAALRRLTLVSLPIVKELGIEIVKTKIAENPTIPAKQVVEQSIGKLPGEFGQEDWSFTELMEDIEKRSVDLHVLTSYKILAEIQKRRVYRMLRQYHSMPNAVSAAKWLDGAFESYRKTLDSISNLQIKTGETQQAPIPFEVTIGESFKQFVSEMSDGHQRGQMLRASSAFVEMVAQWQKDQK